MNFRLLIQVLFAALFLSLGEILILWSLPWFGSEFNVALCSLGATLSLASISLFYAKLLNRLEWGLALYVVAAVVAAVLLTIFLVALTIGSGLSDWVLSSQQYTEQDTARVFYIFNTLLIHIILVISAIGRVGYRALRVLGSFFSCILIIAFLDVTLGILSNHLPISDPGARISILLLIYTPILWLCAINIVDRPTRLA